MKPSTVALRDWIVAALQHYPGERVRTMEVADRIFPGTAYRHYSAVYANLRALAAAGTITHHPSTGADRNAYWSTDRWPEHHAELEKLWDLAGPS